MRRHGEREITGIVAERRADRERYARYIYKPAPYICDPDAELIQAALRAARRERREQQHFDRISAKAAAPPVLAGPSIGKIMLAVIASTGFSRGDLIAAARHRALARARQMLWGMLKILRPDLSYPTIGKMLLRDHTTAMHGVEKFCELRDQEPMRTWLQHPAIKAFGPIPVMKQ